MKTKVVLQIAVTIIILFGVGMLMTFVPEMLREFFGDTPCNKHNGCGEFDSDWYWGARHYWYNAMMILLFILGLINAAVTINNIVNKNYNIKL